MKKNLAAGISTALAMMVATLIIYYILLYPNRMHASIADIIDYLDDFNIAPHLLALGLLSVYIGIIMLGATLLGILSGKGLCRALFKPSQQHPH